MEETRSSCRKISYKTILVSGQDQTVAQERVAAVERVKNEWI